MQMKEKWNNSKEREKLNYNDKDWMIKDLEKNYNRNKERNKHKKELNRLWKSTWENKKKPKWESNKNADKKNS